MPDWCENKLVVSGDEAEVDRFLAAARSDQTVLDFERLVPLPDPRSDPLAASADWRVPLWGTGNADNPSLEELDPDDEGLDDERAVRLVFRTPLSPPEPVVEAASEQFPGLTFRLSYRTPAFVTRGFLSLQGGEVLEDTEIHSPVRQETRDPH